MQVSCMLLPCSVSMPQLIKQYNKTAAPNLCGSRNQLHWRNFFHAPWLVVVARCIVWEMQVVLSLADPGSILCSNTNLPNNSFAGTHNQNLSYQTSKQSRVGVHLKKKMQKSICSFLTVTFDFKVELHLQVRLYASDWFINSYCAYFKCVDGC